MKPTAMVAVLALTLLPTATPRTLGQKKEARKFPAVYAGTDFSMGCGRIQQTDWVVRCDGGRSIEFRMWDVKNPTRVTLIRAKTVQYDLSTSEVRPEGDVSITVETRANEETIR
jgi:hypothetical protein